jgi:hypothetical protein
MSEPRALCTFQGTGGHQAAERAGQEVFFSFLTVSIIRRVS